MRVTENTNYDTIRESIRRSKERMEGLQHQSATMKKLNQPSDDPIGASKVLEMRTDRMNNDQYQMNSKMAEAFLNNSDHALGDLAEIVLRAKEIAINQSSAASSSEDTRLGVSEEITQLFKQAVSTGNRKVGDRFLFGGFKTQKPPVDPEGKYLGDDGQMMIEIGNDVFISMNVPGVDAFNTNPKRISQGQNGYGESNPGNGKELKEEQFENVNLFDELQNFRIALLTGDLEGIRGTLDRFDQLHGKLVATRAKLGSRLQGLHSTTQSIERHNVTNAMLSSTLEDADMAQVVSDLGREETVFKSSLASSKRLIQPTLLDFLR
jgi:flagellar hook-associated protein 3 FlgL